MVALLCFLLALFASPFKSNSQLEAENVALRYSLAALRQRVRGRVQLTTGDRLFFIHLYRWFPAVLSSCCIDLHCASKARKAAANREKL